MKRDDLEVIGPTLLLGAVAGARSMTGIAAVARARAQASGTHDNSKPIRSIGPRLVRRLGNKVDHKIAGAATLFAIFELMADKTPNIPDRIDPGPLFGRVLAGGIVGGAAAQMTGLDKRMLAAGGAVAAFAGAHLSYRLRRSLSESLPPFVAAVVEDAIVVGLAAFGARMLGRSGEVEVPRYEPDYMPPRAAVHVRLPESSYASAL